MKWLIYLILFITTTLFAASDSTIQRLARSSKAKTNQFNITNVYNITNIVYQTNQIVTTTTTTNIVWVDPINGNDENAIRNDSFKPSKTIANALSLSQDNDIIKLQKGEYFIPSTINLSNRSIMGSGIYESRLYGGVNGSSVIIQIYSGTSYISDLTIESTNKTGQFVFNINSSNAEETFIILDRVQIIGDSDGVSFGGAGSKANVWAYDSVFKTHYDAFICSGTNNVFELYRCKIDVRRDDVLFGGTVRGFALVKGIARLEDCSIFTDGGVNETYGIFNIGGNLLLKDTQIISKSTNGLVRIIYQDNGSTIISGNRYDQEFIENHNGIIEYQ